MNDSFSAGSVYWGRTLLVLGSIVALSVLIHIL